MDKVQKHNSFNTNTPLSESYKNGMRKAYKILVRKFEWKRPLPRPRNRWEDNIRMNLRETGLESEDWVHLGSR
jgi:hypothetical protein